MAEKTDLPPLGSSHRLPQEPGLGQEFNLGLLGRWQEPWHLSYTLLRPRVPILRQLALEWSQDSNSSTPV